MGFRRICAPSISASYKRYFEEGICQTAEEQAKFDESKTVFCASFKTNRYPRKANRKLYPGTRSRCRIQPDPSSSGSHTNAGLRKHPRAGRPIRLRIFPQRWNDLGCHRDERQQNLRGRHRNKEGICGRVFDSRPTDMSIPLDLRASCRGFSDQGRGIANDLTFCSESSLSPKPLRALPIASNSADRGL